MTPIKQIYATSAILALGALIGCAEAEQSIEAAKSQVAEATTAATDSAKSAVSSATEKAKQTVETAVETAAGKMDNPGADLSTLPSGTYKSEQGHAYVAFTYWHQGYTRPILRWRETNATIVFDNENPENSTLEVMIPAASIDSGVDKFDEHLVSADFFDVETYPTITFKSTDVKQSLLGSGSVTGDMTIKGITKPVTFIGKINKVGENFRSGVTMFGVSATANIKRSDFDLGKYAPSVGDDVEIMIEVEFQKAE